jgi:hypothetical protein
MARPPATLATFVALLALAGLVACCVVALGHLAFNALDLSPWLGAGTAIGVLVVAYLAVAVALDRSSDRP